MKTFFLTLILAFTFSLLYAQTRTICGTVSDIITGEPLPFATVVTTNNSVGTVTDVSGKFSMTLPSGRDTVVVSFVGYEKKVFILTDITDTVQIQLEQSSVLMNSVMVTDYKEPVIAKDISYSYSMISVSRESSAESSSYYKVKGYDAPSYKETSLSEHYNTTNLRAGLLTAGEVNDFQKWKLWGDITVNELKSYRDVWDIYPEQRFLLQLENKNKMPVTDAQVILVDKNGKQIWQAHTDNTGKAELWASLFDDDVKRNDLSIKIKYHDGTYTLNDAVAFKDGVNILEIPVDCDEQKVVDIAFVVDATGSMSDELEYLKVELTDVINKVKDTLPEARINLALVFYRDIGDEYVTRFQDFTDNVNKAVSFIEKQIAAGGGDGPEAVDSALDVMVSELSWSSEASSRLVFMVLDASPHAEKPEVIANLKKIIPEIAEKGIRVIPIACSGIDKGTEYFLRSLALATNGTYVFLTDDSGIGYSHIKPTTDKYDVELLNEVLIRIITSFSKQQECKPLLATLFDSVKVDTGIVNLPMKDTSTVQLRSDSLPRDTNIVNPVNQTELSWKYYPNPTNGPLNIEVLNLPDSTQGELYFTDITGKVLRRFKLSDMKNITTDISEFPTGTYMLRVLYDKDKWLTGKIILLH